MLATKSPDWAIHPGLFLVLERIWLSSQAGLEFKNLLPQPHKPKLQPHFRTIPINMAKLHISTIWNIAKFLWILCHNEEKNYLQVLGLMKVTNTFWLDVRLLHRREVMSDTVNLIKNPMSWKPIGLNRGIYYCSLLNGHGIKLPFKYLCLFPLYISATLNLGLRTYNV